MKVFAYLKMVLYTTVILLVISCQLQEVPFTKVSVTIMLPENALQAGKDSFVVKLTNISTGRAQIDTTDSEGKIQLEVEEGVYDLEVTGQKTITTVVENGTTQQIFKQKVDIRGLLEKALVTGDQIELTIGMEIAQKGNGFVIQEVYFTGSTTPANGNYYQDQYIRIFNNSDSVLYADGLSILESNHLNTTSIVEYADFPNDLIVGAVYTIPGDGKTYPLEPGKSIVIASLGINHKTANANSPIDLSQADFEWYDAGKDVDVPEVTNMIRNFCYSNTIWLFHVRGSHSYAIFKTEENYSDFITKNTVLIPTASGSSVARVKIANSLILDGVDLGSAGNIGSKSLASSIDVSFTYCDASYSAKSVRRKVLKRENGRVYLQDTNNSAQDFIPNATPKPWDAE